MQRSVLTIRSWADALQLNPYRRDSHRHKSRSFIGEIKLEIPALAPSEQLTKERELNRLFFACGCGEATAFGLIALVGMAIWMASRPSGLAALAWTDMALVVGGFFAATGVGKTLGRLRARHALQRAVNDLHRYFKDEKPPTTLPPAHCGVT